MVFKCKPVYNFQSIEFEWNVDASLPREEQDRQFELMWNLYAECVKQLQNVAVDQPALAKPVYKPTEPMATPGQINFLISLGMPKEQANRLTKKQASAKIEELNK